MKKCIILLAFIFLSDQTLKIGCAHLFQNKQDKGIGGFHSLDISKGETCSRRGSYFGCKEVTKEIGETLQHSVVIN